MKNSQDIKRRIKSIESNKSITKAMQMVATAKLRKTQQALALCRPYEESLSEMVENFHAAKMEHPFFTEPGRAEGKKAFIIIGASSGLCGAYNINLNRFAEKLIAENGGRVDIITIGSRPRDYFRKTENSPVLTFVEEKDIPGNNLCRRISEEMSRRYLSGEYREISLVYADFQNVLKHQLQKIPFLPVEAPSSTEEKIAVDFIFEPDKEKILARIMPLYLEMKIYLAILSAKASEIASRMTAMSSATDNADKLLTRLRTDLNRARQEAITTEIAEIVSGAANSRK